MIKFDEAAEKIGADTVRYLYAGAPVSNDVRFGYNLGDEARRSSFHIGIFIRFLRHMQKSISLILKITHRTSLR